MEIAVTEGGLVSLKPVISIKPRDSKRITKKVKAVADRIVGLKSNTLDSAVQRREV